jgi:hypothetical protein
MKRIISTILVVAAVTLSVNVASANTPAQRIHRREAMQRARIRAGWRQGDLTRGERWRLRHGEKHVRRMEWRARRDGHINRFEHRRIARAQNRQSRRIYRLRHNRRERAI